MGKTGFLSRDLKERPGQHVQTMTVDGCKITVRYNEQGNPNAVSSIRAILLATATAGIKCKNLHI